ncbi:LysR family transcriptional regulator [Methyloversatilis thermotolerans]|uniref:LysR family transcriptional regulator n=1 Tax=Methyloversatilis thermotolerans TaxID=1346290 RepID=UPI000364C3EB|nr:LysR family transcriptional regulator [Methyloversatilis thermotolerans]
MDQIEAMRIYTRVAELGSFTATAENLGLLKSTVSNAVQQLEATLGARLFHRTTRKVQLTQDGQAYYERCRDLIADFDELNALFAVGGQADLRGRLRVDLPLAFARDLVIPRLPEFLERHPQLEIEVSSTDRRVDLVREGFDCVLRVGPVGDHSLIAVPLGQFEQINCASRAYVERHGMPLTLADLAMHRMVHYAQTLGTRPSGFEYVSPDTGEVLNVPMQGVITVNNSDAYREACRAGLGIIQAPRVGAYLDDGALVEVLPEHRPPPLPISLVYANRRHLPLRVKAFIEWMKTVVPDRR